MAVQSGTTHQWVESFLSTLLAGRSGSAPPREFEADLILKLLALHATGVPNAFDPEVVLDRLRLLEEANGLRAAYSQKR